MAVFMIRILNYIVSRYRKIHLFPFWLFLFFLSLIYKAIVAFQRRKGYRHAVKGVFVVSVGNLTTGGTGKTEATDYLCGIFAKRMKTAIILRGYGGKHGRTAFPVLRGTGPGEAGDEAVLHKNRTSALVIAARKRREGVLLARKRGCRMAVLDDAFQHWDLKRNFNLVLVDHTNPFGNGHLLPAGILREPLSSLSRADAVLITKCEKTSFRRDPVLGTVRRYNNRAPVYFSRYVLDYVSRNGRKVPLAGIKKRKVLLFAGLGNTDYFISLVKKFLRPRVLKTVVFPDHYAYRKKDAALLEKTAGKGYEIAITTEKDHVRLSGTGFEPYIFHIRLEITGRALP